MREFLSDGVREANVGGFKSSVDSCSWVPENYVGEGEKQVGRVGPTEVVGLGVASCSGDALKAWVE